VRYAVVFEVPVLETSPGGSVAANNQVALFTSAAPQTLTTGVAAQMLLATATANGLGAVNTAGSILLPAGNYLIDYVDEATAATNMTIHDIQPFKNGATLGIAPERAIASTALLTIDSLGTTGFVSLNGTDTISVQVTCAGTGALAATGQMRIVAI